MPVFSYKARNIQGNILTGTMEAAEQRQVIERLRNQKFIILDVGEVKPSSFKKFLDVINILKPRVKSKDLVLFSRQLSTLVNAGVPIVQGLSIVLDQLENPAFKKVIATVRDDIEGGLSIGDSLAKHPDAFSTLYVSMVKAGELGGILDVILERLSAYLEASNKLKGKVKGALVYPAVISLIATGVTIFLLTVVIPTFGKIFSSFGADLPIPTQILIAISDFLRKYIPFMILGVIGLVIAFRRYYKTEDGKQRVDRFLLRVPMFGELVRKVAVAKFTRTLGTLIKSGVPILQALETVAQTAGNKVVEETIMKARESIREGERIAEPLKQSAVFPPMVIQMISVGEETGNLDTMLGKIADFYDEEVDVAIQGVTSMIEPIIIVIMGIVIGAIVIAMFLPMFSLGELAGKMG